MKKIRGKKWKINCSCRETGDTKDIVDIPGPPPTQTVWRETWINCLDLQLENFGQKTAGSSNFYKYREVNIIFYFFEVTERKKEKH